MSEINAVTDMDYAERIEKAKGFVFIDFYSPSCGPCVQLLGALPQIEQYFTQKKEEEFKAPLQFWTCNITQNPKLATKYQVRSVPLCILVGPEKNILFAETGARDYAPMIEKHVMKKTSWVTRLLGFKSDSPST